MKIGIVDDLFVPLQGALLKNDNVDLKVFVRDEPEMEDFADPTHMTGRSVEQVMGLHDFDDCDFIIAGDNSTPGASSFCKQYYPKAHVMYYSNDILLMESDRMLSNRLLEWEGVFENTRLRRIESVQFSTLEEAKDYLSECDKPVVIKVDMRSVNQHAEERTLIVKQPQLFEFPENNPWFADNGVGGCIIEDYIEGQEISFGMWFHETNGWVGLPYYYVEHKGAWEHDMGGVLTGEVGTTLSYFNPTPKSEIMKMFRAMTPIFKGKVNGMIDFNTRMVITENGPEFYLMEFTMRFGRPTLECQINAIESLGFDVATVFTEWMAGNHYVEFCPTYAYHTVGVCGFSYGHPVLNIAAQYCSEKGVDSTEILKLSPSYGTQWKPSDFNEVESGQVLPMFGIYRGGKQCYVVDKEERHFMAVASSYGPEHARDSAYALLENVHLKGIVWRSDIGSTLHVLAVYMEKYL